MRRLRCIAGLLVAAGLAAGFSCSSTPAALSPPPPIPEERPQDFVLAATVLTPTDVKTTNLPRSLRPARYIVEADGVLRAAVGAGSTTTTYPPQTRQLTARQMDSLWRQLRESNLLDPGNPSRIDAPEAVARAPDRTTALIFVGGDGRRVTLRVLLDRRTEDAVAAERLVDRLADLAWIR